MAKLLSIIFLAAFLATALCVTPADLKTLLQEDGNKFTQDQLLDFGYHLDNALLYIDAFSNINPKVACARKSAFLAQTFLYSKNLAYLEATDEEGKTYEGRADLGNVQPGDGVRYKPRGAYKVVGRKNYQRMSKLFGVNFEEHPEWVSQGNWVFKLGAAIWKKWDFNFILANFDSRALRQLYIFDSRPSDLQEVERNVAKLYEINARARKLFGC